MVQKRVSNLWTHEAQILGLFYNVLEWFKIIRFRTKAMTKKLKAAIYARVSTTDKGQDPENQLRELRRWCKQNNYTIAGEYIDRESGRNGAAERAQFRLTNGAQVHLKSKLSAQRDHRIEIENIVDIGFNFFSFNSKIRCQSWNICLG